MVQVRRPVLVSVVVGGRFVGSPLSGLVDADVARRGATWRDVAGCLVDARGWVWTRCGREFYSGG